MRHAHLIAGNNIFAEMADQSRTGSSRVVLNLDPEVVLLTGGNNGGIRSIRRQIISLFTGREIELWIKLNG
jgi:hypothetical protein